MEADILGAAGEALLIILTPWRLLYLFSGVCLGLMIGLLPGIGGLAAMALLLPFTYGLDPAAAFALLLGLASTATISDPITAIVLGAPGHAGSAATTLDGYQMTKRGEAGRALGAAYLSATVGGVFGALLLGLALPAVRPLVLQLGSPELLAFAIFGASMVAVLSGSAPLRGLAAACIGMMLSMVGTDPHTGTPRWTMGSLYLWEGIPLVPLALGVFALPELADLFIAKMTIVKDALKKIDASKGLMDGARDVFRNWFLVLRCSWLGAIIATVPGIGVSVIDWISYGHALRTEKGASETFGRGDVRGVIASESAGNSREGGALVPTLVFGVPTSAGMAILLGAFLIHGLVPGPDMVTKNLNISYSMVWSIAIANILGGGLCFLFSGYFAKIATLRYTLILPCILTLVFIGAYSSHTDWGDLFVMLSMACVSWTMKHLKWPRPPLVLGYILGEVVERNLFISLQAYGMAWVGRPIVLVIFALALIGLMRPLLSELRHRGGIKGLVTGYSGYHFEKPQLFIFALLAFVLLLLYEAMQWPYFARIVPTVVGSVALVCILLSFLNAAFRKPEKPQAPAADGIVEKKKDERIHMDIGSNISHLPLKTLLTRAAMFMAWLLGFMLSIYLIGFIPSVPIFIVALMRSEGREPWKIVAPMALFMTVFVYIVFGRILMLPWPMSLLGTLVPALKIIPSV